MYNVNRYHHPVNTNPTREELGQVYRYIKGRVTSSGETETVVTYKSMENDLKVDYDNLRFRIERLEGMRVIGRRLHTARSGKTMYLYRILK